ncbi:SRPBCC family protein [Micromonosporaceae bacterium Da 78-11]
MTERSAVHDTFVLDRHYDAAPARVFRAFADREAKAKWFTGPPEMKTEDEEFDFREGGRETMVSVFADGTRMGFHVTYVDIVPDERIVYSYEMTMNGRRISVSVATVEIRAAAGGADLVVTEQGVYLDGLDQPAQRRQGTEHLLTALGASL